MDDAWNIEADTLDIELLESLHHILRVALNVITKTQENDKNEYEELDHSWHQTIRPHYIT